MNSCHAPAGEFDACSSQLAVGTHGGTVLLYDLRSSRPVLTKVRSYTFANQSINVRLSCAAVHPQDHMYGIPMVDVKWHTGPGGERRVISSDSRIAKIWCEHRSMRVAANSWLMRRHPRVSPGKQALARHSRRSSRRQTSTTCAYGPAVVRAHALPNACLALNSHDVLDSRPCVDGHGSEAARTFLHALSWPCSEARACLR